MLTPDERLVLLMAEQLEPDDIVVQGIATPIVFAAFLLARAMHAPDLQCLFTVGNSFCESPSGSLELSGLEDYTASRSLRNMGMLDIHCDTVPSLKVKEFLRPAQVDGSGNTNNVVIGDWHKPKVRLPGAVGITDVLSFNPNIFLYVTRHDARTLVESIDFCSGLGRGKRAKTLSEAGFGDRGPLLLLTPEAVFDLKGGDAILTRIVGDKTVDEIRSITGFSFDVAQNLELAKLPSKHTLNLLRKEIDPLGIRNLEILSGSERLNFIRNVLLTEAENRS